jgi:hypothetical protein
VLVRSPAVGLLAIVAVEGVTAYQADTIRATRTTRYDDLGERIERSLPARARVLGPRVRSEPDEGQGS